MSDQPAGTRVVSAVRSGKLRERWSDPQYAEKERARLRSMAQEQRDALTFWRAHPELRDAAATPPATADAPTTPPPAPTPPAKRARPRRRPSSAVPRQAASSSAPAKVTPPATPAPNAARGSFFLRRRT